MKQQVKRSIKTVLEHAGLSVTRSKGEISVGTTQKRIGALENNARPLDWSEVAWSHPLEAAFAADRGDVLLTVPFERTRFRTLHGFRPHWNSREPYIKTLRDYIEGRCVAYPGSALESFYAEYQPDSAACYMRLEKPTNTQLETLHPTGGVYPWLNRTPDKQSERYIRMTEAENKQHGRSSLAADGYKNFGPTSRIKGELEFKRLVQVMHSIRQNGFSVNRQGNDNIQATLLVYGDDYRFVVRAGHHRIAALAALGAHEATVQLVTVPIARRSEAKYWPLVQKGWFNEREALAVFDRIFQGRADKTIPFV